MKIIHEIKCPCCDRKQRTDIESLWKEDLFWQPCEFCNRYGLYKIERKKLTSVREWMMSLYGLAAIRFPDPSYPSKKEE
jgi:hypothetical protein